MRAAERQRAHDAAKKKNFKRAAPLLPLAATTNPSVCHLAVHTRSHSISSTTLSTNARCAIQWPRGKSAQRESNPHTEGAMGGSASKPIEPAQREKLTKKCRPLASAHARCKHANGGDAIVCANLEQRCVRSPVVGLCFLRITSWRRSCARLPVSSGLCVSAVVVVGGGGGVLGSAAASARPPPSSSALVLHAPTLRGHLCAHYMSMPHPPNHAPPKKTRKLNAHTKKASSCASARASRPTRPPSTSSACRASSTSRTLGARATATCTWSRCARRSPSKRCGRRRRSSKKVAARRKELVGRRRLMMCCCFFAPGYLAPPHAPWRVGDG